MNRPSAKTKGSVEVPFPFSLLFIPLLLIGGAISIPWAAAATIYVRRKERRFVRQMRSVGRFMPRDAFVEALAQKRGALIEEWFSNKGPVRYWWTEHEITARALNNWTSWGVEAVFDRQYDEYSRWCHEQYLHAGNAMLVSSSYVPELEYAELERDPDSAEGQLNIPVVAVYSGRWLKRSPKHN